MIIKVEGVPDILVDTVADYAPSSTAQIATVTTDADIAGHLNGKYFQLWGRGASVVDHQIIWFNSSNVEISTATCLAEGAGGFITGDYFVLYSANDANTYWVWYNINTGGGGPTPGAGEILVEVPVVTADTAIEVADATVIALDAISGGSPFISTNVAGTSAIVTMVNTTNGDTTDIADSAGAATGFTFGTTNQGSGDDTTVLNLARLQSRYPKATLTEVQYHINDSANDVAAELDAVIDDLTNFGTSTTNNIVTITNGTAGSCYYPIDGEGPNVASQVNGINTNGTAFALAVTTAGDSAYSPTEKLIKITGWYLKFGRGYSKDNPQSTEAEAISVIIPPQNIISVSE